MVDLDSVENALEQYIREGEVVRQFSRPATHLDLFEKETWVGKNVSWDVTFGTGSAQRISDGQDITTFSDDAERMATLPWAILSDAIKITALAESASASSRTELARMFVKKLFDTGTRIAEIANQDVLTGEGGGASPVEVHGLSAAAGPLSATGTYAGIDRATFSEWAANLDDGGEVLRDLDLRIVDDMFEDIYVASGTIPDLIATTPALWRAFGRLLKQDPQQRIELRGQDIKLRGGFGAFEYNGTFVVKDKDIPSGEMNFYNTRHIRIKQMPPNDRVRARDLAMIPIAGTIDEQTLNASTQPLMARVRALAESGDYNAIQVICWLQLAVDKCNAQGRMTHLQPASS